MAAAPAASAALAASTPEWERRFGEPGRDERPITWYFPHGPDRAQISADLDQFRKLGLGGICIMPAEPTLQVPYLSAAFWETIRNTVEEALRLGFRVWLYDELGYPSTSAGGETIKYHPEYVVTALEYREGASPAFVKRVGDPLSDIAKGRAGLVRPLGNLLDANATREFVSNTYEGYRRAVGRYFGKGIEAMFTDEPCLHTAGFWDFGEPAEAHKPLLPWVDGFAEYFRARKGYDIEPQLECLVKDAGPETRKVRCDYWEVVCDLILEGYYEQLADWCGRNGLVFSGHQLLEEGLLLHLMFSGSFFRNASRQQIPGMDLIGPRPEGVSLEDTMTRVGGPYVGKMLSSAAHTRGRTEVMSESFAASGYEMTLEKIMAIANWQFATGVTEIMPMGRHHLPDSRKPPDSEQVRRFFADDFFKDPGFFSKYLGRIKALLTGGLHVADVAVLVPEVSIWANYTPAPVGLPYDVYRKRNPAALKIDDDFIALSMGLLHHQLDFDYLDDEAFLKAAIRAGKLELAGESYGVLVVPGSTTMRYAVAEKVSAFRRAGGLVFVSGRLPEEAMERGKDEALAKALSGFGPVQDVPAAIRESWRPDVTISPAASDLYYIHKRKDGRDIYFFANMAATARDLAVTFRGRKGNARRADPRGGQITPLRTGSARAGATVELRIEKLAAEFVIFG